MKMFLGLVAALLLLALNGSAVMAQQRCCATCDCKSCNCTEPVVNSALRLITPQTVAKQQQAPAPTPAAPPTVVVVAAPPAGLIYTVDPQQPDWVFYYDSRARIYYAVPRAPTKVVVRVPGVVVRIGRHR